MAKTSQRAAARKTIVPPTIAIPAVPVGFPIISLSDGGAAQQPQEPSMLHLWKMLKVVIDNQVEMAGALNKIHDRVHAIEYKADHDHKAPYGLLYRIFENVCGIESMLLYVPED